MPSVINTNINSLNAQRNLGASQNSLTTSMQRLSSGMRINSAKDDAAGLAISERMTAQIKGLTQAGRNANDGISLAQTAESALGTISTNLQRVREIAVQSRNATNSNEDRAALQKEVVQLKAEIGRVASQTSFNGNKLLDGSFSAQAFQVGANQGDTITIASLANANVNQLGSWTSVDAYTATTTGVAPAAFGGITANAFSINGVSIGAVNAGTDVATQGANVAAAINKKSSESGVVATAAASGAITLTSNGSSPITVAGTVTNTGLTVGSTAATITTAGTAQTGFAGLSVDTVDGADNAILAMDAALKSVNSSRADLGAIQNRFESVVSNLASSAENLTASRSRITDADFAAETANLSRSQILQQAGTAMVAQANQLPQGVLSLLR